MNKELLQQYANLKEQERQIAEEISKINPLILAEIRAQGVDKVEAKGVGTFSVAERKTWSFSPQVIELEESVEKLKVHEKATGIATSERKPYLMFKSPKKDE